MLGAVRAHWNEKSRVTLDRMHEEGVAAPLTSGLMPLPEMRPIPAAAARPNHVFPDHVQPVAASVDTSSVRPDDQRAADGNASDGALPVIGSVNVSLFTCNSHPSCSIY